MTYVHVYIIILLNIAISIIKEYKSEVREKKLVNETIFVIFSLKHILYDIMKVICLRYDTPCLT